MILRNIPAFMRINQLKLRLVGQQTFTAALGAVGADRKEPRTRVWPLQTLQG